jgi:hypothetical protein
MPKVFGGGSNGGVNRALPTPSQAPTQSFSSGPNVFSNVSSNAGKTNLNGGSAASCSDSGISRVLPTSQDVLNSSQNSSFSSGPNVYSSAPSSTGDANLQDFYTKSDIQRLLKTKADISSVYAKAEIDARFTSLEAEINSSLVQFITEVEVNEKISDSYDSILSHLAQNYYNRAQTYNKSQIDTLIAAMEVGDGFVLKQPTSTVDNTISPGANEAVPLTLIASTDSDITTIQHWIDNQSNSVGRVRTSGRVEFYGHMVLGQNIESWRPALDVNLRRISGVSNPIHLFDAVNKKYMEDYVVRVVDDIQQGENDLYDIDCLTY